jgi:hypothetical protein
MPQPTLPAGSARVWFLDLRKASLAAFILTVLALAGPLWTYLRTILGTGPARPHMPPLAIAVLAVGLLCLPILPLFYFALYRDGFGLPVSARLRALSLAAAIVLSALVAMQLAATLAPGPGGSVLTGAESSWTAVRLFTLLAGVAEYGAVFPLLALWRRPDDDSEPVPPTKFVRVTTQVAVAVFGAWVAFNLMRLVLIPLTQSLVRDAYLQAGRTPPGFGEIVAEALRALLEQACLLAAPYVVWRAGREGERAGRAEPAP